MADKRVDAKQPPLPKARWNTVTQMSPVDLDPNRNPFASARQLGQPPTGRGSPHAGPEGAAPPFPNQEEGDGVMNIRRAIY